MWKWTASKTIFKRLRLFVLNILFLLCGFLGFAEAAVDITSVQVSNTSPSLGETISVTVNFCDSTTYNNSFFLAAFKPTAQTASITGCPVVDQTIVVSNAGVNVALSAATQGYQAPGNSGGSSGCPIRQMVWSITVPSDLTGGTSYRFLVCGRTDWIDCTTGADDCMSVTLAIPLPPPSFHITKRAVGPTAAPNELVLFTIDYDFTNTTQFVINDTVPANTTLVAISPGGSPSTGGSGTALTWNLGDATGMTKGQVWMLLRVGGTVATGDQIFNTAKAHSSNLSQQSSNAVASTVGGGFNLLKSQSSGTVTAGTQVTYTLNFDVSGESLRVFDYYDNGLIGFDGTPYNILPESGENGTWARVNDGTGNYYIRSNGNTHYPMYLRSSPISLCSAYTVEGDLQIDLSQNPSPDGVDAHLVIMGNGQSGAAGQYYMVGISADTYPAHLFIQENDGTTVTNPATSNTPNIVQGVWYTVKAALTPAGTSVRIQVKVWARGTAEPGGWMLDYTDATPRTCTPTTNYIGFQADYGVDLYDNLKMYSAIPIVNARLYDTLPAGLTYVGASNSGSFAGGRVIWTWPGSTYDLHDSYTWWATANTCVTIVNQASIDADNPGPPTDSNAVTLTVVGCTTPTFTPTPTPTKTPTPTSTNTPTPTPTNTPTRTNTPTPTNTPIVPTPTRTPTPTPTPTPTDTPVFCSDC